MLIAEGADPLGDAFCIIRSPEVRRSAGATYTPHPIVDGMVTRAQRHGTPVRVVDPGAGSGRFLVAAGRRFPHAELVAVELDPLAVLLCRAHLAVAGLAHRARVTVQDFRALSLPCVTGTTLFLGNPPYVRHHDIEGHWKTWLSQTARGLGFRASQLAGAHVHFFVKTATLARPGDVGMYVTSAEWLDVNYGDLVRRLFAGPLGGVELRLLDPSAKAFPDAMTSAVIAGFRVGATHRVASLRHVDTVDALHGKDEARTLPHSVLLASRRWTSLFRATRAVPQGFIELGELCRVSRGQVTGSNAVWILGDYTPPVPASVLRATVTRARELIDAGDALRQLSDLRCVVDLPEDLDTLSWRDRQLVEIFLKFAKDRGASDRYIARHRRPWWAVRLHLPAPILATYMARRPPAFVRNLAGARHINIAHGLYPRVPLSARALDALGRHLNTSVTTADGRTYAGGLTKFEPKEMERLLVPSPEMLVEAA